MRRVEGLELAGWEKISGEYHFPFVDVMGRVAYYMGQAFEAGVFVFIGHSGNIMATHFVGCAF